MDSGKALSTSSRLRRSLHRDYPELPLLDSEDVIPFVRSQPEVSALEDDSFPFEALSEVAEIESWRKEINRPIYHIHKWWAQRLGSVFRAVVLGAFAPSDSDLMDLFYRPTRIRNAIVFDPFMGSGTTLGEVLKLGARAIGRDINPVAHFLVRNALAIHDRASILQVYKDIERDVATELRKYYRTMLPDGRPADVLYYFWVKIVSCPNCSASVDLFSSFVFAQHAYPRRNPNAQAICPQCGEVNTVRYDTHSACCTGCGEGFNPQSGPVHGQRATCPECREIFPIAKTVRLKETPPDHRLYAKLVLLPEGGEKVLRHHGSRL